MHKAAAKQSPGCTLWALSQMALHSSNSILEHARVGSAVPSMPSLAIQIAAALATQMASMGN